MAMSHITSLESSEKPQRIGILHKCIRNGRHGFYGMFLFVTAAVLFVVYFVTVLGDDIPRLYVFGWKWLECEDSLYPCSNSGGSFALEAGFLFGAPASSIVLCCLGSIYLRAKNSNAFIKQSVVFGFIAILIFLIVIHVLLSFSESPVGLLLIPFVYSFPFLLFYSFTALLIGLHRLHRKDLITRFCIVLVAAIVIQILLYALSLPKSSKSVTERAISERSYEPCNKVRKGWGRLNCYQSAGIELKDSSICNVVDGWGDDYNTIVLRSRCWNSFAQLLADTGLCNNITHPANRDGCKEDVERRKRK